MEVLEKKQDALAVKVAPSDNPMEIGNWITKLPTSEGSFTAAITIRGAGIGKFGSNSLGNTMFEYTVGGDHISFTVPWLKARATFDGTVGSDRITGMWTANGMVSPLILAKDLNDWSKAQGATAKSSGTGAQASNSPAESSAGNSDCDGLKKVVSAAPASFKDIKPLQQAPDSMSRTAIPPNFVPWPQISTVFSLPPISKTS
jgi:hypothetical protein